MKEKLFETAEKIKKIVLQAFFPQRCPVCDRIAAPHGERFCSGCFRKMKVITPPWCMKCGKKLESEGEFCKDCRTRRHYFTRGRALYEYSSVADSIYRFKYSGRQEYADSFGNEIADMLGDFIREADPQALIPIPLHKKRFRRRGYNQAELLAKSIGRAAGVPVATGKLVRIKNTKPLKLQNLTERQNNLKKAFIMNQNEVKLERVILIDDIYTTGSTMDEAAKALLEAGVKNIYFITIACGNGD